MKNFVYLDEYKMYSMSSQIMEGVTEYIMQESREALSSNEMQGGPIMSGRKMGEILENASSSLEKKFLHDYAYSIFESKLLQLNKIFSAKGNASLSEFSSSGKAMIRIKAPAQFIDATELSSVMRSLVDMQEALAIISRNDEREKVIAQLLKLDDPDSKSGRAGVLKKQLSSLSEPPQHKIELDNDRLNYSSLAQLINQHLKDRLDVMMKAEDFLVRADLKRSCLKEDEDFIFKTYSRHTKVELVLVGIVTQLNDPTLPKTPNIFSESIGGDEDRFRSKVIRAVDGLQQLDSLFLDGHGVEMVVDPIALYLEID